jgi:hypothetical protein
MMFSGSTPRFEQLRRILGGVLMIPTYFSFVRWAQEAWYLVEIKYYTDIYWTQPGMDLFEVGGATALCDVHLSSLHSAHANLTRSINMQLRF